MLTWLDSIISRLSFFYGNTRENPNPQETSEYLRALGMAFDMCDMNNYGAKRGWQALKGYERDYNIQARSYCWTARNIVPFLADPLTPNNPETEFFRKKLAIQLTPELIEDFHSADAPESIDFYQLVKDLNYVYIDFPRHSYQVEYNNKPYDLRALFLMRPKSEEHGNSLWVTAIFSMFGLPNEPADGMMTWRLDEWQRDFFGQLPHKWQNAQVDSLVERLNELMKLAIIYYSVAQERHKTEIPQYPSKKWEKLSSEKKRRNKLHTYSLFRVIRLYTPEDRFKRKDQEKAPSGGWKLGIKVRVRGHFKMQVIGKGRKDRKLIYVAAYTKGPEGAPELPKKQDLYRVASLRDTK